MQPSRSPWQVGSSTDGCAASRALWDTHAAVRSNSSSFPTHTFPKSRHPPKPLTPVTRPRGTLRYPWASHGVAGRPHSESASATAVAGLSASTSASASASAARKLPADVRVRMVRLDAPECSSARLAPALSAECALALAVLWRLVHQVQWRSHPRRVFFHLVLLLACALRGFSWAALCRSSLLSTALALLWVANALLLLCAAAIVFTWAAAVAAGRVPTDRLVRSKRCWALHPLVLLHVVHLGFSLAAGIDLWVFQVSSSEQLESYLSPPAPLLVIFRAVNAATVAVDGVSAARVALQLRSRLLSAAMTDDMKRKSVLQMTLLIAVISAALALQLAMDVVVLAEKGDLVKAFGRGVAFSTFCQLEYFAPGLLLSIAFLYIMRRVEQRDPARLVVLPARSLVEFVECSSPNCVWCAHHRRFHDNHRNTNGRKWDLSLFAAALSLSPQTVDSSVHSAAPSSAHANLSLDSWPSSTESIGPLHVHGDHHLRAVAHPPLQHSHTQDDNHYRAYQPAPPQQTQQQVPRQHGRGRDRNPERIYPRIR